ncbi:hypothetical protein F8M41_008381 [Gigaspora margarita]|uniref:Uncharacterized protein n=1 Tax=Gigaspora margarita TaxID=4874 RepID=A0A8H4EQS8_GIGMA|nr:hypothetical protein F8M41_008381 [Gigaspora margarita]
MLQNFVETQTEEFETKEWFYEEFGWKNGNSTPFNKVAEQNNEDSTLEQSTKLLVCEEVKTSTPNSEYKNRSNDSQQTVIKEDNSVNKFFLNILLFIIIIIPYFFIRIFFFIILFYNFQEILIRLRLSTNDFVYELDSLKIKFTQTTISSWFRGYDGYNIEETTKYLVSGKLNPKILPIIRVCIINREFF